MSVPDQTTETTELFTRVLGGQWHLFSSHVLGEQRTESETESQEAKMDLIGSALSLRPGDRVLDVGCGWGGPLTYMASRFGITGTGISLVPQQCEYAARRAAEHGVDLEFRAIHWADFVPDRPYDAVMTSGVVVHFADLAGYFSTARDWLAPGGRLLNEEMHLRSEETSHEAVARASRSMAFLDEVRRKGRERGGRLAVVEEGRYVTLEDEMAMLTDSGFEIEQVLPLSMSDYQFTVDRWLRNCESRRAELTSLTSYDAYRWYRTYFRLFRRLIDDRKMTLDVVVARRGADAG